MGPPTLERILASDDETQKAFDKLIREGMDSDQLAKQLSLIPTLPKKKGPLIPGKSEPTAKIFPDRIERLASDIEQTNLESGLLYDLALYTWMESHPETIQPERMRLIRASHRRSWLRASSYERARASFQKLPLLLRAYAAYLRHAIREKRPRGWHNLQKFGIVRLLSTVKTATGSFYFADIAQLLDAAFVAAGQRKPKGFDEDQLRKLYKNNPFFRIPPSVR